MDKIKSYVKTVKDFPKPGVLFYDIAPIFEDNEAFSQLTSSLTAMCKRAEATKVVGIESRGFILGAAVARQLGVGFVMIRKAKKLPRQVYTADCTLEYGTASLEIHRDSVKQGERVVVLDDVLATGGTAKAATDLVENCGGTVAKMVFMIELLFLNGREKIARYNSESVLKY